MSDPILHHYPLSPFAEKVRSMLGYKGVAWRSVQIPVVMPKPDLVALTGGYRKTPALQIGADVYCDTRRIARELDLRWPERPLAPPAEAAAGAWALGQWCDDRMFFLGILMVVQPGAVQHFASQMSPEDAAAFQKDRIEFMKGGRSEGLPPVSEGKPELLGALARLEAQLTGRGPYLFGEAPCEADFCVYAPLWTLRRNPVASALLEPWRALGVWLDRMEAIGHGESSELLAEAALAAARDVEPRALQEPELAELDGVALGDEVEVSPTDYGVAPSRGRLLHAGLDGISISRTDARAGALHVHFPRTGFRVSRAA